MTKPTKVALWPHGIALGFQTSLANSVFLPLTHELFSIVSRRLRTGQWNAPIGIVEMWMFQLVVGFVLSLLPNVTVGVVQGLGMRYVLSDRGAAKWVSICVMGTVSIVAALAAARYLYPLSFSRFLTPQKGNELAVILFVVQLLLYACLAIRLRNRYLKKLGQQGHRELETETR